MIDAETKRVSRLVAIQTILQGKLLITASELAKRFEVSCAYYLPRRLRNIDLSYLRTVCNTDEYPGKLVVSCLVWAAKWLSDF